MSKTILLFLSGVLVLPIASILISMTFWAISWFRWKRRQLRLRAEWTQENPYWPEAFEAGAKWAREGDPRAKPNLTQLRMPGKE